MTRSKCLVEVRKKHASSNTKYHVVYGYKHLNLSRRELSRIYGKDFSTVCRWITEYEQIGHFEKPRVRSPNKVLDEDHVKWIKELYENEPTLYLKETRERFFEQFGFTVHHSTISRTLRKIGFTRKVLERRALQIKKKEIDFFCKELQSFHWDLPNLVFLDEVSFTNTEMFRTYGYGPVGERILVQGKFQRLPRISLLCFLGLDGLLETSITAGTFTRRNYFEACRRFALSGKVRQYPGVNSVWILDGAIGFISSCFPRSLQSFPHLTFHRPFFSRARSSSPLSSQSILSRTRYAQPKLCIRRYA